MEAHDDNAEPEVPPQPDSARRRDHRRGCGLAYQMPVHQLRMLHINQIQHRLHLREELALCGKERSKYW